MRSVKVQTFLPVDHKCPENSCQQNLVSFKGQEAPVEKEREMRADDRGKPLSEVPMPGMGAVEICHAVEDVELQEVELNQGPLRAKQKKSDSADHLKSLLVGRVHLFIENRVDQCGNQQSCGSKIT